MRNSRGGGGKETHAHTLTPAAPSQRVALCNLPHPFSEPGICLRCCRGSSKNSRKKKTKKQKPSISLFSQSWRSVTLETGSLKCKAEALLPPNCPTFPPERCHFLSADVWANFSRACRCALIAEGFPLALFLPPTSPTRPEDKSSSPATFPSL